MLNEVQIGLFLESPPSASEIAGRCFPKVSITNAITQQNQSVVELEGELERRVVSSGDNNRVDFHWEVRGAPPKFPVGEIRIEDISPEIDAICEYIGEIVVSRVAFVLKDRTPFSSSAEVIDFGKTQIPNVFLPDGATELSYRTNVPKCIDGIEFNRIMILHNAALAFVALGPGGMKQHMHQLWERVVDINSDHENALEPKSAGVALKTAKEEAMKIFEGSLEAL